MVSNQKPFSEAENNWDIERLYVDLAIAKREVAPPSAKAGLTDVEKTHLRGLLCSYKPADIARQLNKDPKGVDVDLSRTLYRYVEKLTNREENTVKNWRDIVNWLEAAGYRSVQSKQKIDWDEAPEVSVFYGRDTELKTLKEWIVSDRCRVVALLGMGGIGKTAIAVRTAEQIQDEFDYIVWRSLRHSPALQEIGVEIVSFLSCEQSTDLLNNDDRLISTLLYALRQHRVLLIFDAWETVLGGDGAGPYKAGYEKYGEFLRRMTEERHRSCLVIASQERPEQVSSCEGRDKSVRSWKLEGLEKAAAINIFTAEDLNFAAEDAARLIDMYSGNPLALIHISKMIQEFFNGSVTEFLKLNTIVVPPPLEIVIRERLESLSEMQKQILFCLASEATLLDSDTLRSRMSPDISKSIFVEHLYSLFQRSLIERSYRDNNTLFTLQGKRI